jgi:NADH-quinone oxidoreductase subunit N
MNWQTVLTAMLPEHLLLLGLILLIIDEIATSRPRGALVLALATVAAAAAAAAFLGATGVNVTPFPAQYSVAPATSLAKAIVLALAIPVLLMSRDEFDDKDSRFHLLLLSSLYGFCLLLSAESFLTLFLGLELMSIPVYVLVLLAYQRPESVEAALKYLVLGGTATAMFLMGVSLLYGGSGSLALSAFTKALGAGDTMAAAAVALIVIAFFLKAAIVPFHAWAHDAYEGASLPVTAYMATIIKAGVLLAALRVFG